MNASLLLQPQCARSNSVDPTLLAFNSPRAEKAARCCVALLGETAPNSKTPLVGHFLFVFPILCPHRISSRLNASLGCAPEKLWDFLGEYCVDDQE